MQFRIPLGLLILASPAIYGQSESSRVIDKSHAYVRRFSAGATLSVYGLVMVKDHTSSVTTTNPPVAGTYTTTGLSNRMGFGGIGQIALTSHFALNGGFFFHRVAYKMTSDEYYGVLEPGAIVDTRTHVVTNENTHGNFYDIPVAVRWYAKSRFVPGPRWFVELGGAYREVSGIGTSKDVTINSGNTSCCSTTPIVPALHSTHGFIGGLGGQFIDPFGIRVIPEVRYTRWQGKIFDNLSTVMQLNQVEAMISFSF